ncbi:putative NAD+ ADP-ribosyltransferase [Metarhizium acridum CQMa 102]|uniref:Poly [ADP-ribose] polymerase n=1 Tax=Metarhizium acridum (strain CQMa 102) TaxID=655827 RepID=E9E860_METAQ|nr:putative NAD+ ADP-ribosyltransferase [Metarhizium acridum CQMa 102]EFY87931.1 putative NAD+ ADP-ribosyltransferase [Metarhizium acridum CQMa 102]
MPATRGRRTAAAAAVPANPLQAYRLAFSGKFPGYSHKDLNALFTSLGASVTPSVNGRNTHLVCDEKDFLKKAPKVRDAEAAGVSLVKPEWVAEVAKLKTNMDPSNYLWPGEQNHQGGDETPDDGSADGSRKKRPIAVANSNGSDRDPGADDGPAAKKLRGKAAKVKDEAKEEGEEAENNGISVKEETIETKLKELSKGQFLKKKDVVIPVDERCPLQTYAILFQGSTYKTWTRWGRVGEMGQNAILGDGSLDDAKKHFEKKFRDKSGLAWKDRTKDPKPNKYAFVERSYDDDSDDGKQDTAPGAKKEEGEQEYKPPECTLPPQVREVMELIFNQNFFNATMSSLNYDANKLPLGKLSKATILRGFQQLKDLASLMDDPTLATSQWNMTVAEATEHLSNTYYSLIPHAFGRNRPPIINNEALLKKEIELLESLSDMKDASNIMKIDRSKARTVHPMDSHFRGLGMDEMTPLDHSSSEFDYLQRYLNGSKGSTHGINYKVHNIFRIRRAGEYERFNNSVFTKIPSDRRLLWHGSRCTNFGGILSQGLRIAPPEAPVSGYMFGKGIYLADMSTKSANYCCSYISNSHALLLLCEAELGDPLQKLTDASYSAGEDAKKGGMYSTWGMGSTGPSSWMDAGAVHHSLKGIKMPDTKVAPGSTNVDGAYLAYNEYIYYDVAQVKLRYLFHVEM